MHSWGPVLLVCRNYSTESVKTVSGKVAVMQTPVIGEFDVYKDEKRGQV
jgi:hypothetical protein